MAANGKPQLRERSSQGRPPEEPPQLRRPSDGETETQGHLGGCSQERTRPSAGTARAPGHTAGTSLDTGQGYTLRTQMLSTDTILRLRIWGAWPDMSIREMPWWALRGKAGAGTWPVCPLDFCAQIQGPKGEGRAQQACGPHLAAPRHLEAPLEHAPVLISGC